MQSQEAFTRRDPGALQPAADGSKLSRGLGWLSLGLVIPATYAAGIIGVAAVLGRDVPLGVRTRIPVALATMHLCWGAGFLTSSRGLLRRMARPAGN